MQKILTILGTRPELIRLSRVIPKLDRLSKLTFVYTNQNFTPNLRDIFFADLGLRQPDYYFEQKGSLGEQLADIFPKIEKLFIEIRPDKVFILGDTNSALCAIIAERMGIPVYHAEAGNRSYDKKIPEEVNRRLIDSISSYNLTYTQTSKEALIHDGCHCKKVFLCGNPTKEVLEYYKDKILSSEILNKLGLNNKDYYLADFHRSENVNTKDRLLEIINGLNRLAKETTVVCSIHPHTLDRIKAFNIIADKRVIMLPAMGFFDFVKLEQNCKVGLTDSGLVSEELNLLKVPCVIMRDTTERPEAVEAGGAIISGINAERIYESTKIIEKVTNWQTPVGWDDLNVSDRIVHYILGERQ